MFYVYLHTAHPRQNFARASFPFSQLCSQGSLKKVKMEKHVACKETQQELTTHLSYFSEK